MRKQQEKMFHLIYDDVNASFGSRLFDVSIISLIVLNVVFVILDTFQMPPWYGGLSGVVEAASVIVFSIEYLLRLWVAPFLYPHMRPAAARLRYAVSFMAVIDLLAVLPFYINILPIDLRVLRAFRIVRLMRIFKVNRYTDALATITEVFKKRASQLVSSMVVVGLLLVIASVLMWNVEHVAQPGTFENALDGLWWALGTITGGSDIAPVTVLGKFLSAVISLLGIGIVAVPTGIISAGFVEALNEAQGVGEDTPDKIRAFKKLLDEGAITQEEYELKKRQILDLD